MSAVEIVDRHGTGWLYAKIPQKRGAGRAIFKALRTKDQEEARRLIREAKFEETSLAARADALTREVWSRLLAGRNLKVHQAVESYETHRHVAGGDVDTIRNESLVIDRFVRHAQLAAQPITSIEATHISAFVNQPGEQMLSTREKWLSIVSTWLEYVVDQRWIVRNPAADVAVRLENLTQEQLISTPYQPFTDAEVRALLAKVPRTDFWHGAILFAYHYGLRIGAVATLEDSNVVANRLRLYTRKGRRVVDEPLADEIWTWLQEWRSARPPSDLPYLFPAQAAVYQSGSSLLSVQFGRLLKRHGVADRSFHSLRKTAAQNRWEAELQELGPKGQRAVIALVAKHGMAKVQEMLAHAPGSGVTEEHYLNRQ